MNMDASHTNEAKPAPKPSFEINPVRTENDLEDTIELFYQYVKWLDLDLTFQDFDAEMAAMPGKYSPPNGRLLLARNSDGKAIGCVALRPLLDKVCEMKRLYVLPEAQGIGTGKALMNAIIEIARQLGYEEMRLDTLPRMKAALKMYLAVGFVEIAPYYSSPLEDTHFLGLHLTNS